MAPITAPSDSDISSKEDVDESSEISDLEQMFLNEQHQPYRVNQIKYNSSSPYIKTYYHRPTPVNTP